MNQHSSQDMNRRKFVSGITSTAAAAAMTHAISVKAHAAGDDTIKVALIGCGGRGTGAAAQILGTPGPAKLWAMADLFPDCVEASFAALSKGQEARYDRAAHGGFSGKVDVSPERRFAGFDAYKQAIDSGADLVILATHAHFRPMHFAYAVAKGKHVFMEKPLAVDAPGIRQVLAASEEAKKQGLKVSVGLHNRHSPCVRETVRRLRDGAVGPINLLRCYWNMSFLRDAEPRTPEMTEMVYQLRNPYRFQWLSGDYVVDALMHYLDIANWIKGAHPVSAQGMGGRSFYVPEQPGDIFDHHAVEFAYEDGTVMVGFTRQMLRCWNSSSVHANGPKGAANITRGKITGELEWQFNKPPVSPYQREQDVLMEAIHKNSPHNEVVYAATATMTGILGRMASYSGQMIRWDDALKSEVRLAPERYAFDAPPPVLPGADGCYPIPTPGVTKVL
jgi:predicted dehydrogenase